MGFWIDLWFATDPRRRAEGYGVAFIYLIVLTVCGELDGRDCFFGADRIHLVFCLDLSRSRHRRKSYLCPRLPELRVLGLSVWRRVRQESLGTWGCNTAEELLE